MISSSEVKRFFYYHPGMTLLLSYWHDISLERVENRERTKRESDHINNNAKFFIYYYYFFIYKRSKNCLLVGEYVADDTQGVY